MKKIVALLLMVSIMSLFSAEQERQGKKLIHPDTGKEIDLQRPPMYHLMRMPEYGGLSLLKEYIRGGINVNHFDPINGKSLLFFLIDSLSGYSREEGEEALDLMIAHGVDLKQTDNGGNTVLHRAAQYKEIVWCLEKFIAAGVEVNAHNKNDESPLCNTVRCGPYTFYEEAAKILIQHGANSDSINKSLFSAVRYVSCKPATIQEIAEQKTAIAFFLYHGANFETQDAHGLKPYNYAYDNQEIRNMLENKETVKQAIEWFTESRLWTVD